MTDTPSFNPEWEKPGDRLYQRSGHYCPNGIIELKDDAWPCLAHWTPEHGWDNMP